MPPNFVFNLDEADCHDYVDAKKKKKKKKGIVPKNSDNSPVSHPVKRSGKSASAIVCISGSGISCIPQITVPRATIDSQIYKIFPQNSFQISQSPSGYVNMETVKKRVTEIFIPNLNEQRIKKSSSYFRWLFTS